MDITELRGTVLKRFQELTDTEQTIVETMGDHPIGEIILKVIGPELTEIFSEPEGETDRMLADDMPNMPSRDQAFGGRMDNREDEDIPDLARDMPEEFREPMGDMPQEMQREMDRNIAARKTIFYPNYYKMD